MYGLLSSFSSSINFECHYVWIAVHRISELISNAWARFCRISVSATSKIVSAFCWPWNGDNGRILYNLRFKNWLIFLFWRASKSRFTLNYLLGTTLEFYLTCPYSLLITQYTNLYNVYWAALLSLAYVNTNLAMRSYQPKTPTNITLKSLHFKFVCSTFKTSFQTK